MSRYINAEWLSKLFPDTGEGDRTYNRTAQGYINSAPSIDIIHCGECRYCDKGSDRVTGQTVFICQRKNDENLWEKMNADDFCSYGERNSSEKPNNSKFKKETEI